MFGVGDVLRLLRSVDRLLALEKQQERAFDKIGAEIAELKGRVTRLEAREEVIIVEARAAAGGAATQVAIASVSDMARRIGKLEERSEQRRLGGPE